MLNENVANKTNEVTELDKELENYSLRDVGYVYVIEDKEKKIVKVGRSAKPSERILNIKRSGCVEGREYVSHQILGMSGIETAAHKALDKYLISNEWFKISFKKAVGIVSELLPKEIAPEQIEALEKKDREHSKQAAEYIASVISPGVISFEEREAWITAEINKMKKERDSVVEDAIGPDPKMNELALKINLLQNKRQEIENQAFFDYTDDCVELLEEYGVFPRDSKASDEDVKRADLVLDYIKIKRGRGGYPIVKNAEEEYKNRILAEEEEEKRQLSLFGDNEIIH